MSLLPSPSHSPWRLFAVVVFLVCALSSCSSLKKFVSNDLDRTDEDLVIGSLYEDEVVRSDKPYIPKKDRNSLPPTSPARSNSAAAALVAIRTASDDGALFETLMPWMGTPYKYGGETRDGVDCSGFVGNIYRERYGIKLHRSANDIQKDVSFVSPNQLRQGDILFFTNSNGKVSHVGIFLKDGTFVHASTSNGVSLSRFDTGYWAQHLYKCGRVKR